MKQQPNIFLAFWQLLTRSKRLKQYLATTPSAIRCATPTVVSTGKRLYYYNIIIVGFANNAITLHSFRSVITEIELRYGAIKYISESDVETIRLKHYERLREDCVNLFFVMKDGEKHICYLQFRKTDELSGVYQATYKESYLENWDLIIPGTRIFVPTTKKAIDKETRKALHK